MERLEAQHRLFNAIQILMRQGWTEKEVDALITGLHRADAVDAAERAAEDRPTDCDRFTVEGRP